MPRPLYDVPLRDGSVLPLGRRTLIMGVLNVTPDSFSDGGHHFDVAAAIRAAREMVSAGADILDVGGESTRPGAAPLPVEEELRRVVPVLEAIRELGAMVSIDTYKAAVAERAIELGALFINDISAMTYDPPIAEVAARLGAVVILMHNRGRPSKMYEFARYDNVIEEIGSELAVQARAAGQAGIARERIVIDPGFGFAKRAGHSLEALARMAELHRLGYPILSGPSRKSFLQEGLGERQPSGRIWGTAAAVTASVLAGAHIVRVHDVPEMADVIRVADSIDARATLSS
ncbi:MAG: dihydropteroate synthase [Acidobacteriota bacterium]|nr:dihydropteroate synthase [Acidobacteriota bacterium]